MSMLVTIYGKVTGIYRNSDGKRKVTVTVDKQENEYTTTTVSFESENYGLDQKVAIVVQPVGESGSIT